MDIRGQHGCPDCQQVFAFAQSLANHMVTHGYDKPEPVAEPKKGKRKQSKLPMKDRKRVTKNLDHYIDDENVEEKERFDDQYHVQDDIMDDDRTIRQILMKIQMKVIVIQKQKIWKEGFFLDLMLLMRSLRRWRMY